jgi:hypothetical protein
VPPAPLPSRRRRRHAERQGQPAAPPSAYLIVPPSFRVLLTSPSSPSRWVSSRSGGPLHYCREEPVDAANFGTPYGSQPTTCSAMAMWQWSAKRAAVGNGARYVVCSVGALSALRQWRHWQPLPLPEPESGCLPPRNYGYFCILHIAASSMRFTSGASSYVTFVCALGQTVRVGAAAKSRAGASARAS